MKSLINRPLKPFSILADMGDNWGFDLFDKSDSMKPPCDMVEKTLTTCTALICRVFLKKT